ncbi:hypothetical protein LZ32DRAFT_437829 [Colletotrichum eremochloae]|nr:hypothetical protein LZ32DRAFT_437829 [Colletotrichum eremochloae]
MLFTLRHCRAFLDWLHNLHYPYCGLCWYPDFWHYPVMRGYMRVILTLAGLVRLSSSLMACSILPFPARFPGARHAESGRGDLRLSLMACTHRRHSRR